MTSYRTIFGIDLRTLALVRVCLGALIIADLLMRSVAFTAHYTDAGVLPREAMSTILGHVPASLHMISGAPWITALLFIVAGIFGLLLMLGYRSRTVAFISWILLISLDARNQWVSQGGDMLLRVLVFWAIFLPIGARFSVDAALDKSPQDDNAHFSIASAGLLLQVVSVYFFTALLKSAPEWIPDGTAVYYALSNDALATPVAVWLRQFPLLMNGLTYFVWTLEILVPVLVFFPFFHTQIRLFALALLMSMHIGFLACLDIALFPLISLTSLLCLTPPAVWDWLSRRVRTPERAAIRIYFDDGCTFCEKTCRLLITFLILPDARLAPAQSEPPVGEILEANNSWVVYDQDGNYRLGWPALAWLIGQSPVFGALGRVFASKLFRAPGDWFYQLVADHRPQLGRLTARLMPYRTAGRETGVVGNLTCSLFIVVMIWVNLGTLTIIDVEVPGPIRTVASSVRLNQAWTMFAPVPGKLTGWFVALGALEDGRPVDLYLDRIGEPNWSRETYLEHNYDSYRWRKYFTRLPLEERVEGRPYYLQYLCTQWHNAHPDEPLATVKLYFIAERTQPYPQPRTSERTLTWRSKCGSDPLTQVIELRKGILPELS